MSRPDLPVDPPKSAVGRFAALMNTHELEALLVGVPDATCTPEGTASIIVGVSGGAATSCAIEGDAIRCAASSAIDLASAERALCSESSATVPSWADAVARFLHVEAPAQWQITQVPAPHGIAALRAEITTTDGTLAHAIVRAGAQWRPSREPIGRSDLPPTFDRILDTSAVTGGSSFGLITEARDGGSEMGEAVDMLDLLCERAGELRACGRIQLGYLAWQLSSGERAAYPGGASSLRARPHVEVLLEPRIAFPDRLVLSRVRSTLSADEETWGAETLATLQSLLADAGEWRYVDGRLVRTDGKP